MEPGDHAEAPGFGWGVVMHIDEARSTMTVELFQGREWIERQPFPEWDVARKFERVAARHQEWDVKDASCTPGKDHWLMKWLKRA